jgi:hypothetical protein
LNEEKREHTRKLGIRQLWVGLQKRKKKSKKNKKRYLAEVSVCARARAVTAQTPVPPRSTTHTCDLELLNVCCWKHLARSHGGKHTHVTSGGQGCTHHDDYERINIATKLEGYNDCNVEGRRRWVMATIGLQRRGSAQQAPE